MAKAKARARAPARTLEEHVDLVREHFYAPGLQKVDIATFRMGTSANFEAWMDELCGRKNVPVRILMGLSNKGCERAQVASVDPCIGMAKLLLSKHRNLRVRYNYGCHLKLWIFHRKGNRSSALVGGRNLNVSDWVDLTLPVTDIGYVRSLRAYFAKLWSQAGRLKPNAFMASMMERSNALAEDEPT